MAAAVRLREPLSTDKQSSRPVEWKRHIIRQLKRRDKSQMFMYQDLIKSYSRLLEKSYYNAQLKPRQQEISEYFDPAARHQPTSAGDCVEIMIAKHQDELTRLQTNVGELACQVLDLKDQVKLRDGELNEQYARISKMIAALEDFKAKTQKFHNLKIDILEKNSNLKEKYDTLLEHKRKMDKKFQEEEMNGSELLQNLMRQKEAAAENVNKKNATRIKVRNVILQQELVVVAETKVDIKVALDLSGFKPPFGDIQKQDEKKQARPFRYNSHNYSKAYYMGFVSSEPITLYDFIFRSASLTSPRILDSIKELFEFKSKRRGNSVSSLSEDVFEPMRMCIVARIPARPLHVLEAHELGINAVKFRPDSKLLATGGTDRIIKLWDVTEGRLQGKGTLEGSNEGITSIEFDHSGTKLLAASYDHSAIYWSLDNSTPKCTLTGHSRKVTSAKFKSSHRHVVTGSVDRTVKIWDLQRIACIHTIDVNSSCSEVVCEEYFIISGHYDQKIRFWDSRAASCTQEVSVLGRVTSLDLSLDHMHLLSCSRDDSLRIIDLRMNNIRKVLQADGFKCGSDSTKAIFSPDGGYAVAGSSDGALYIWNVTKEQLETCLSQQHSSSVNAVAWSVSGEHVVSVDRSKRAVLWSA
ncbi:protein Atg16l2-like [Erpetoichthys calabaricus]|uniref:protein Atg16l2-like n=1 Tax=Erpetoichthys calabaricus TaxID=27687 RepID=UPI002234DED5|nr:protein Atg16l2-like [Erpetoichthys calabaricus]